MTDGRSLPHPRRFVCVNPNLREPHTFTFFPRDTTYYLPNQKHPERCGVYRCPDPCGARLFSRRTVLNIPTYPDAKALYQTVTTSNGWKYNPETCSPKTLQAWRVRDKALVALIYLAMLRISEALRLRRRQFKIEENSVTLTDIRLSKRKRDFVDYRPPFRFPVIGERAPFTELIIKQLESVKDPERFVFVGGHANRGIEGRNHLGTRRAWDIVNALTGAFNHFFRAVGEDYMVRHGVKTFDLAKYIKVDEKIIGRYVHGNPNEIPPI